MTDDLGGKKLQHINESSACLDGDRKWEATDEEVEVTTQQDALEEKERTKPKHTLKTKKKRDWLGKEGKNLLV